MRVDTHSYKIGQKDATITGTYEIPGYQDIPNLIAEKLTIVNHIMSGSNYAIMIWVNCVLYREYYHLDIQKGGDKYIITITAYSRASKRRIGRRTTSVTYQEVDSIVIKALEFIRI